MSLLNTVSSPSRRIKASSITLSSSAGEEAVPKRLWSGSGATRVSSGILYTFLMGVISARASAEELLTKTSKALIMEAEGLSESATMSLPVERRNQLSMAADAARQHTAAITAINLFIFILFVEGNIVSVVEYASRM